MGRLYKLIPRRTAFGLLTVLLLWYGLHLVTRTPAVPSPVTALAAFVRILPGTLAPHLLASLGRILTAIAISLAAGAALGLWMGVNPAVDKVIGPVIFLLFPIPKIAFLPVFMILLGLGNVSKVALIISILFFQIVIPTRDGVRDITRDLYYAAYSLGMKPYQLYRHLLIPAVTPNILSALRVSIGTSMAVLFISENFATTWGIGYFLMNRWTMANYVEMYGGIIGLSMMGYSLYKLVDGVEFLCCKWIRLEKPASATPVRPGYQPSVSRSDHSVGSSS